MLNNDPSDADADADVEEGRGAAKVAREARVSIRPGDTACLPANLHDLPSLPLVYVSGLEEPLLWKEAYRIESIASKISSARISLKWKRGKNCSMSVHSTNPAAWRVLSPLQTHRVMIAWAAFRSFPAPLVPFCITLPLALAEFSTDIHLLQRARLTIRGWR